MEAFDLVVYVLVVQAFYGMAVTGAIYTLPSDMIGIGEVSNDVVGADISESVSSIQTNLGSQTSIPVVGQLGALIYYSGNILIDFLLNFLLALPQIISIFFTLIGLLFGFDATLGLLIRNTLSGIFVGVYLLGVIQLFLNMRSGQRVN